MQAYNYRLCLTNRPDNRAPFTKPAHYNRDDYASIVDDVLTGRTTNVATLHITDEARAQHARRMRDGLPSDLPGDRWGVYRITNIVHVPNSKTDANNQHDAFVSTDLPEENWPWPTSSWEWRDRFAQRLREYTEGLFWFAQNDPALPAHFRKAASEWGPAKDELIIITQIEFRQLHGVAGIRPFVIRHFNVTIVAFGKNDISADPANVIQVRIVGRVATSGRRYFFLNLMPCCGERICVITAIERNLLWFQGLGALSGAVNQSEIIERLSTAEVENDIDFFAGPKRSYPAYGVRRRSAGTRSFTNRQECLVIAVVKGAGHIISISAAIASTGYPVRYVRRFYLFND